jgi:hypothetical protein
MTAERMCRAHPDDCPNGPGPHAYYNPQGPVETWTHCCCCADTELDDDGYCIPGCPDDACRMSGHCAWSARPDLQVRET